ncbi:helix-turn-helix domain-containing protein [Streptomyces hygroscopicus]|uniref:helix-turn-helix domain-containing protein n=1 Tax=Streptomyces hygroscopicus TaxID=1912 RepID=UPI00223F95C7|nr:XRE family transcriptional regulator [Streptomyces hygroscopicus]
MRHGAARTAPPYRQAPSPPGQVNGPFVTELRDLKERTGLSLAALAARTPYSKSAWHRYLNGVQRPPRSAVEALAGLAGVDVTSVLALWETAERLPVADAPPRDAPAVRAARPRRIPLSALVLVVTIAAVAVTLVAADRFGAPGGGRPASAVPRCRGASCQGHLPDVAACDRDAQTKSAVRDTSYAVRLEYSPSCGAVWGEVRAKASDARVISVRAGRDALSATYPGDGSGGSASPMLAVTSPEGVEACARVDGKVACTGLDDEPAGDR